MPLRLTVGCSRKIGQPRYGSLGATCQLECELDGGLFQADPDRFQVEVRQAYAACAQAVHDELARQQGFAGHSRRLTHALTVDESRVERDIRLANAPAPYHERWATPPQGRAIRALANKLLIQLEDLLKQHFQVATVKQLTSGQASQLIQHLQDMAQHLPSGKKLRRDTGGTPPFPGDVMEATDDQEGVSADQVRNL